MGGPIDMEPKGYESIGCETHIVILNFDLTHDFDFWFSRSIFEIAVSQECESWSRWNEMDESIECYTYYVTLSYDFDLGFWWSN